jgi:hypothetical protein
MNDARIGPGDRVVVTDLRGGSQQKGTVIRQDEDTSKLIIQYDEGPVVRVGRSFVFITSEK